MNPYMRKVKYLPPVHIQHETESYTAYGFGYDPISNTYKVVTIQCYVCDEDINYKVKVYVFTLETNSWRRIEEFPTQFL